MPITTLASEKMYKDSQQYTSLHLLYCDDIDNGDDNSNVTAIPITAIMIKL